MTQSLVPHEPTAITMNQPIDTALDVLLYSLSDSSKRQYEYTFKKWTSFCQATGIAPHQMNAQHIIRFLEHDNLAHSSKQARLSHIRKLLETMHAQQPDNTELESLYKQVKLLKVKRSESDKQADTRPKHALTAQQVHEMFRIFKGDTKQDARNRCLLAILLYCGLRRAEASALKWSDIDLETMLITVQHGKGDKERTIPILGGRRYIETWQAMTLGRTFVFCGFRKGDKLREDKPIQPNAIYKIIKPLEMMLGIEGLSPHDARRTLITNLLNNGASVSDVQFIAGHANPQTTLGYAVVKDAKEVLGRVANKVGY